MSFLARSAVAATTSFSRTALLVRSAAGGPLGVAAGGGARLYHERVVEHYENPRNVGASWIHNYWLRGSTTGTLQRCRPPLLLWWSSPEILLHAYD